jgi:RecA/RadA recombinase
VNPRDPPVEDAKSKVLTGVLSTIERSYGKGSIQRLGDSPILNIATTSSGSLTLDLALGGGYPRGRVVEIYGPESSGKTTLALHAVAEVQRSGGEFVPQTIVEYRSRVEGKLKRKKRDCGNPILIFPCSETVFFISTELGRHRCIYRCRARSRSGLCAELGC